MMDCFPSQQPTLAAPLDAPDAPAGGGRFRAPDVVSSFPWLGEETPGVAAKVKAKGVCRGSPVWRWGDEYGELVGSKRPGGG